MIDLSPRELNTVKAILARLVSHCEVRAFGSRVTGRARKFSDLDLLILCPQHQPVSAWGELRQAFDDSDLPFSVDLLDAQTLNDNFRRHIYAQYIVLQSALESR